MTHEDAREVYLAERTKLLGLIFSRNKLLMRLDKMVTLALLVTLDGNTVADFDSDTVRQIMDEADAQRSQITAQIAYVNRYAGASGMPKIEWIPISGR